MGIYERILAQDADENNDWHDAELGKFVKWYSIQIGDDPTDRYTDYVLKNCSQEEVEVAYMRWKIERGEE